MSHHTTDLGLRIEVRDQSPNPSVPGSGKLLAAAWQRVTNPPGDPQSYWQVEHRDGRKLFVDTKIEAALKLSAMTDDQESAPEPDGTVVGIETMDGGVLWYGLDSPKGQRHDRAVENVVVSLQVLGVHDLVTAGRVFDVTGLRLSAEEERDVMAAIDQSGGVA